MSTTLLIGDCRDILKSLPDKSVHCCVTSPPYFNLRTYLQSDHPDKHKELGIEQTPDEYVNNLVDVFKEVKRVLMDDGTLWLNLASSYAGGGRGFGYGGKSDTNRGTKDMPRSIVPKGLKPKDLIPIPWLVALELQKNGWYLRQDIIWQKNNPMPESVRDRCTKSHEYIFLLSKSQKYYFDNEAIKENAIQSGKTRHDSFKGRQGEAEYQASNGGEGGNCYGYTKKNKRSVWQVNTKPYKGAHFATFPSKLIEPCILAGTSEHGVCSECGSPYIRVTKKTGEFQRRWSKSNADGSPYNSQESMQNTYETVGWQPSCSCNAPSIPAIVLDPFAGSGTVGEVCKSLNRNSILIELNPDYKTLIEQRIS